MGRIALTPMLNERGKLIGDFTMCRLAAGSVSFWSAPTPRNATTCAGSSGIRRPPACRVRPCAMEYTGLSLAGPASRALLQSLVRDDLSNSAFAFMSFRQMDVGMVPALVGRVSFTGDLGYELWVTSDYQRALFDLLTDAGRAHGLKLFGGRALNSHASREKFRDLGAGVSTDLRAVRGRAWSLRRPQESGLHRPRSRTRGERAGRRLAAARLQVDAADADASGDEPIWHDGEIAGAVTSGGFGHSVGRSIALGYVRRELAQAESGFEVEIVGVRRRAQRLAAPAFDPAGARMRS